MKRDDPRMMHAAGAAGLLALTAIAYVTCIFPLVQASQTERDARMQAEFVREDLQRSEQEYKASLARQAELESRLKSGFEPTPVSMLNDKTGKIVSLAERCGLVVSRLRPGEPMRRAVLTDVPLSMSGECQYQSFHAFLALMRVEAPDVELESFEVSADGKHGAEFRAKLIWHACNDSNTIDSPKTLKGS